MSVKCPWCDANMIQLSDEELPKYGMKATSPNRPKTYVCPKCREIE